MRAGSEKEKILITSLLILCILDYSEALSTLESYIKSTVLHPFSYYVVQCIDKAMDCCIGVLSIKNGFFPVSRSSIETEKWEKALDYALMTIEPYKMFTQCNPVVAIQLFKVVKLQLHLNKLKEAAQSVDVVSSFLKDKWCDFWAQGSTNA